MKKFLLSILCCLMAVVSGYAAEETATLSFANKAQRTAYSTTCQVWKQNGVILTNNKSSSTNAVADYANPARFYANSQIIVDCSSLGNITKIVFTCSGSSYATALKNSIGNAATVSGSNVTVTLSTPAKIYDIAKLSGQVRLNSLTVTYQTGTTVEPPTISFVGDGSFDSSIEVTISAAEGTTAYYTLNGMNPDLSSDECPETLTLKADATLKVIAYDAAENASSVVEQEFKLQSSGESSGAAGTATLVTDVTELAVDDQVVIVASKSNAALSTNQKSSNRGQVAITKNGSDVELVDDVQILTLKEGTAENSFAFYTGSGYLYAASSESNYLKTQPQNNMNGSWDITIDAKGVATIKAKGDYTRNWLRYNSSSALFSCYSSGQADVSLYKVNPVNYEDYVLNVSEAGWATLYLGYNVTIPEGVTCYVISAVTAESAILTKVEGDVLPANTGAIIKADEGEYIFAFSAETATVESNLEGTKKNEYITKEAYVLSMVDGVVGLYQANKAGGVFLNNANKAYLPASAVPEAVQGASGFKFRFETTGVEQVEVAKGVKAIYDLSGRKVNDMKAPGLYIVNGKKVLVK